MESRNPTLVRILEEKESIIENRHSGIPTMIREMKKYGLPSLEFYEKRDSFKVIFRNNFVAEATQRATQNNNYEEFKDKSHMEIIKELINKNNRYIKAKKHNIFYVDNDIYELGLT